MAETAMDELGSFGLDDVVGGSGDATEEQKVEVGRRYRARDGT